MANPRQRRKARSGTRKVKQSSRQQDKLKKRNLPAGPAAIRKRWDVNKTARQNFTALSLLPNPQTRLSGGVERPSRTPFAVKHRRKDSEFDKSDDDDDLSDEDENEEMEDGGDIKGKEKDGDVKGKGKDGDQRVPKLKSGQGYIERDPETGKVLRVVLADEIISSKKGKGKEKKTEDGETPWGKPMEEWDWEKDDDEDESEDSGDDDDGEMEDEEDEKDRLKGIPVRREHLGEKLWKKEKRRKPEEEDNEVIRELLSNAPPPSIPHFLSPALQSWITEMVRKYAASAGGDEDEMLTKIVRDKSNVWQRTKGEVRNMIRKAGGIDALQNDSV